MISLLLRLFDEHDDDKYDRNHYDGSANHNQHDVDHTTSLHHFLAKTRWSTRGYTWSTLSLLRRCSIHWFHRRTNYELAGSRFGVTKHDLFAGLIPCYKAERVHTRFRCCAEQTHRLVVFLELGDRFLS